MLLVVVAVLVLTSAAGLFWRSRYGRLRSAAGDLPAGLLPPAPGAVTLVHFSSATCLPCRQVRAVCSDLAGEVDGVRHVEIDAEAHLDAVRDLGIWRLPTLLVVDRAGRIARRTVGVPVPAELRASVREVLAA